MFAHAIREGSRTIPATGMVFSSPSFNTRLDSHIHGPSSRIPENCAYTPLSYPSCLSHATSITPHSPRPYSLLNGGVVLLTPSKETFAKIKKLLAKPVVQTYKFPDQDFLAELFRGRWIALPWMYNALKSLRVAHPNIWRDEDARCVHYIMAEKPWMAPRPDSFSSQGRQMTTTILSSVKANASLRSTTSLYSLASSEETLSTFSSSSDGGSTRAASPTVFQSDVHLDDGLDDPLLAQLGRAELTTTSTKVLSWMGEDENELLRWWWRAFDDLESDMGWKSWWPVVERNVEERCRGRFGLEP